MNWLARFAVVCCAAWLVAFVLTGGTAGGKAFFLQFLRDKAGPALVGLVLPVLAAGTAATLLALREPETRQQSTTYASLSASANLSNRMAVLQKCVSAVTRGQGDPPFHQWGLVFIFVPIIWYALCTCYRHWQENPGDVKEVANAFGMAGLVGMAVLFLPVSRHSSVMQLMGWNPAAAVTLHVWTGRTVLLMVLIHGAGHLYRWIVTQGEHWTFVVFPPVQCWKVRGDDNYMPVCHNADTECSCQDHFRNFTGFVAAAGMVFIGISSLNEIRRQFYHVFYKAHIVAGPLVILFTCLHWKRSTIYVSGGVLYYIASSLPVFVESYRKRLQTQQEKYGGVRVLSVKSLDSGNNRPCVGLTVAASDTALSRYRAAQYVKLSAPSITFVSHPFTINTVPGKRNQMRIIFRQTGYFTTRLADRLTTERPPPTIYLEGFHGSPYRVKQMFRHDVIVLVAGGIGITPFLSLLHKLHLVLSDGASYTTSKVILHWMCRDAALIDFVKKEYFEPLRDLREDAVSSHFEMVIVIHRTDHHSEISRPDISLENPQDDIYDDKEDDADSDEASSLVFGIPFTPSRFSPGSKNTYSGNVMSLIAFSSIAWLGLLGVWYFYKKVQSDDSTFSRIWSPLFVVLFGLIVSIAVNWFGGVMSEDNDAPELAEWTPIRSDEEEEEVNDLELQPVSHHSESSTEILRPREKMAGDTVAKTTVAALPTRPAVLLEERDGRPPIDQLLNSVLEAKQPGLFSCGPVGLMQAIREAVQEQSSTRVCRRSQVGPRVVIYEEAFVM
jgi:predicted ferric reductase